MSTHAFYFLLKYGGFTMSYLISAVQQRLLYIQSFSIFSTVVYHRMMNTVPCAIQRTLLFTHVLLQPCVRVTSGWVSWQQAYRINLPMTHGSGRRDNIWDYGKRFIFLTSWCLHCPANSLPSHSGKKKKAKRGESDKHMRVWLRSSSAKIKKKHLCCVFSCLWYRYRCINYV